MILNRTLEFYGFLKGNPNLIKEDLRVLVLDKNFQDRTDNTETFLVRKTSAGFVYKVRAQGDAFFDTPTDTQTGLYDEEEFYIVFQDLYGNTLGHPARTPDNKIFTYKFRSDQVALNVDLYLNYFEFEPNILPNSFINRPVLFYKTREREAEFLVTTNGQEPTLNGVNVLRLQERESFQIPRDGLVPVKVSALDKFGNVSPSTTYYYNIAFPTVKVFEPVTLREIALKRHFYRTAFLLDDTHVYKEITEEALDLTIAEADEEAFEDIFYVPLEPGINNGTIFSPRFVRLASNRPGNIEYRIIRDNIPETDVLIPYENQSLEISSQLFVLQYIFTDHYGATTDLQLKTYRPVPYGPVIEQVIINKGEAETADPNIVVNVLTKGPTPQVITIGENPILYPKDLENALVASKYYLEDCQHGCDFGYGYGLGYGEFGDDCDVHNLKFGYGYGYDRQLYVSNFVTPEYVINHCWQVLHTAFNEQVPFKLCEVDGERCIYIRVRDFEGKSFPIVKACIVLDTQVPFVNVLNPCAFVRQTSNVYLLKGEKTIGDAVYINGQLAVPYNEESKWEKEIVLSSGQNSFVITAQNLKGKQSPPIHLEMKYEFEFKGVTKALARANAEGVWEVIGAGLHDDNCETSAQIYEIIAEAIDPCDKIVSKPRNVYVVKDGLKAKIISPQVITPVKNTTQVIEFDLENSDPLKFFGPYTTVADLNGNWEIDGVALPPTLSTTLESPNVEIIATALNQDQTEHSSNIFVLMQALSQVELQLNDSLLGVDFQPPFNDLNCLKVENLSTGLNRLNLTLYEFEGLISRTERSFIVDTQPPMVTITSPLHRQNFFTTATPILTYTVTSPEYIIDKFGTTKTIPIMRTSVYLDGEDIGALDSGTPLPELQDGTHTLRVEIETSSRDEVRIVPHSCDGYGYGYGEQTILPQRGDIVSHEISFTYLRPIEVNWGRSFDQQLNIGNDIDGENQADAILEELRILNRVSSDADILEDWRLISEGIRFQNRERAGQLTPNRFALPEQTLVLCHFDNKVAQESGVDNTFKTFDGTLVTTGRRMSDPDNPGQLLLLDDDAPLDLSTPISLIIDQRAAVNQLAIDVFVEEGEQVDRDLIRDSINRIIPARGEALIEFIPVQE